MNRDLPRSFLFVPGNRPERFDKAVASGADAIILDLEDAVPDGEKAAARASIGAWLQLALPQCRLYVRINAADTTHFEEDARFASELPDQVGVMLPKADPRSVGQWCMRSAKSRELIALVETVSGVLTVRETLSRGVVSRLAFGDVDFSVDSGIQPGRGGEEMAWVRTQLVLESRFARVAAPIDGVTLDISEPERTAEDADRARRFGFLGKMCIHPRQVAPVNDAFRPSAEQIKWAQGVLDADAASQGAAIKYLGAMVDKPVVDRARQVLRDAGLAT